MNFKYLNINLAVIRYHKAGCIIFIPFQFDIYQNQLSDHSSMVKKTILKVDINCLKCKKKLLKIVSSLQGVDKIEADEGKGTLTVTGDADPYDIIVRIRKSGKHAEVVSIGPPPATPKPDSQKKPEEKKMPEDKKKPEDKKPSPPVILDQTLQVPYMQMPPHSYYPPYPPVVVHMTTWEEPNPSCTIL